MSLSRDPTIFAVATAMALVSSGQNNVNDFRAILIELPAA
jgi:hypothetical protein